MPQATDYNPIIIEDAPQRKRQRIGKSGRIAKPTWKSSIAHDEADQNSVLPPVHVYPIIAISPRPFQRPRSHRPTFQQLSSFDDILTDILLDRVYCNTSIRKFNKSYKSTFENHNRVVSIIRDVVIKQKDLRGAECLLVALPSVKAFAAKFTSASGQATFRQHLIRYIKLYLPDCPFEISSTNRYTGNTFEATVIARQNIGTGEEIKYLCGTRAILTDDEENDLDETGQNFSLIVTSRNKATSLLAGPVRFVNFDHNANARITTPGGSGGQIFAVRSIGIGDEITADYHDRDFFGVDNCECRCKTCEDGGRNGWAQDSNKSLAPSCLQRIPTELHRKLYGYNWPKTKPKNKHDVEKRVYSLHPTQG